MKFRTLKDTGRMNPIDNYIQAIDKLNKHYLTKPVYEHFVTEPLITTQELNLLKPEQKAAHLQEVEDYNKSLLIWNEGLADLRTNVNILKVISHKKYWTNLSKPNNPEHYWFGKPKDRV